MKNILLWQAFCKLQQLRYLVAQGREMYYFSIRVHGCFLILTSKCSTKLFLTPLNLRHKVNKQWTFFFSFFF